MRFPTISTVSSVQPRTLLLFLLLSGGLVLALAGVVERPHETPAAEATSNHDAPEAAAGADPAEPAEEDHASGSPPGGAGAQPTDEAHSAESAESGGDTVAGTADAHATETANPTEEAHPAAAAEPTEGGQAAETNATAPAGDEHADAATGETGGEGGNAEAAAAEEHEAPSLLGVDLSPLNLTSPRFVVVLLAATLLVTIAAIVVPAPGMLAVIVALSLVGVAASVREAWNAGEELGLFVPLPILAAVLYTGAGALAALQLASARVRTADESGSHASHGIATGEAG